MTERDNPHTDLGYLSPDEGEDAHVERLNRQQIDRVTDAQKQKANSPRRRHSAVTDRENDRDHADIMAELPPGFVDEPDDDEPYPDFPRGAGKEVARAIAKRAFMQRLREEAKGDEAWFQSRLRAYNDLHRGSSV